MVSPSGATASTSSTFSPTFFVDGASSYGSLYSSSYPISNGFNSGSNTTTYARVYTNTGANAETRLVYGFDCSSIPAAAIITDVSVQARVRASSTSILTTRYIQLYSRNTAKGNQSTTSIGTSTTSVTTSGGSWTREELEDARIAFIVQRGTDATSSADIRFYGATLTVTYYVPITYMVSNVQTNHAITIEEAPKYTVTTLSNYPGITISPASSTIYQGQGATITLSGQVETGIIKDNSVDVTSSLIQSGTSWTYTISNIQATHEVIVYVETEYIKVEGTYQEVQKYYKKENGEWVELTRTQFLNQLPGTVYEYGGHIINSETPEEE